MLLAFQPSTTGEGVKLFTFLRSSRGGQISLSDAGASYYLNFNIIRQANVHP
jgi:hypothetical protein